MKKISIVLLWVFALQTVSAQDALLNVLESELDRNFSVLKQQEPVPAYYLSYRVEDVESYTINTNFGSVRTSNPSKQRALHTVVRVGSPELDNTHELKGNQYSDPYYVGTTLIAFEDNSPLSLKMSLWAKTDQTYKDAIKLFERVKANVAVTVEAEDKSPDFSTQTPTQFYEKPIEFKSLGFNAKQWEKKLQEYSAVFKESKEILSGTAYMNVELVRKYFIDTEGTKIVENSYRCNLQLNASVIADDGMQMPLYKSYFVFDVKDLPKDDQIIKDIRQMTQTLLALKKAPMAEVYSGPAILTPEASSVFFHEIFGHRIEGARLKQEEDAQTFKNKVGSLVLPEDFSVIFDPQLKEYKKYLLAGHYKYDDEGVRGEKVTVVENGILKSFLMNRVPINGFPKSNGHGRAMIYYNTVTRQSNMFIETSKPRSNEELRKMLIDEAKKNNNEYGYLFDQVSGGFTSTGRYSPNAFNVTPLVVYRIYVDGRPDELVRGVNLVGTPLAMFSQITAAGNDSGIFNGMCGAESGQIPVAAVSPSIFVKMVETQKQSKSQIQPPILERP